MTENHDFDADLDADFEALEPVVESGLGDGISKVSSDNEVAGTHDGKTDSIRSQIYNSEESPNKTASNSENNNSERLLYESNIVLTEKDLRIAIQKLEEQYPELASLTHNPFQLVESIKILNDVQDPNDMLPTLLSSSASFTREQALVICMADRGSRPTPKLNEVRKALLLQQHEEQQLKIHIHNIAPNLTALLGPRVANKLIRYAGSIEALSCIPGCNLASIGKKEISTPSGKLYGVQHGYISQCDLVQQQPLPRQKQMVRMVSAKASLAARVDATKANPSGEFGSRWFRELSALIAKRHGPPPLAQVKALPIPDDTKHKHRAGRKLQKHRQKFQLSRARQLQNRMEFGKEEITRSDAFGEEIGLGMLQSSALRNDNRAKLSKAMRNRLK